ncbi:hypothetical protein VTL71DRAFT_160 [Oculimacula yallundae]|uniref:Uncharacterized protein n=1 Tax=Oculimacula yallundae TaxID=86028 RepID=A0ABR4D0R6_9HELO
MQFKKSNEEGSCIWMGLCVLARRRGVMRKGDLVMGLVGLVVQLMGAVRRLKQRHCTNQPQLKPPPQPFSDEETTSVKRITGLAEFGVAEIVSSSKSLDRYGVLIGYWDSRAKGRLRLRGEERSDAASLLLGRVTWGAEWEPWRLTG